MGWGKRTLALLLGLAALSLGLWPVTLMALSYLAFSFRKPVRRQGRSPARDILSESGPPWGRYLVGGALFTLSGLALGSSGTLSPAVLFLGGITVVFWPRIRRNGLASRVVPVRDSILLRTRLFPFRWHALAEVKLESQDQTHGIAALDGRLLVFAGKALSAFEVVSVYALGFRRAEEKVIGKMMKETHILSQRGVHLLPLDSRDAAEKLSLRLHRLSLGTAGLDPAPPLPFDVFALQTKEGLVVCHRAFRVAEPSRAASIPSPDISPAREPLLAEVVDRVGEIHRWGGPDEFSSFLAALAASRADPLADRLRTRDEEAGRVAVETPGGAQAKVTRPQLRAIARVYG